MSTPAYNHLSSTQQQKLRKLATQVDSCRQRYSEYGSVGRKASAEETASTARVRMLTPLPRVSHDKDMNERLKSLRSKYEGVAKSAKTIATMADRKQRALMATEAAAQKSARKLVAAASSSSASSAAKKKSGKAGKKVAKPRKSRK